MTILKTELALDLVDFTLGFVDFGIGLGFCHHQWRQRLSLSDRQAWFRLRPGTP